MIPVVEKQGKRGTSKKQGKIKEKEKMRKVQFLGVGGPKIWTCRVAKTRFGFRAIAVISLAWMHYTLQRTQSIHQNIKGHKDFIKLSSLKYRADTFDYSQKRQ